MRSALRQLCRHGIEALRPQKVNDRWRKPVISRRVAADLRKLALRSGTYGTFDACTGLGWDPAWDTPDRRSGDVAVPRTTFGAAFAASRASVVVDVPTTGADDDVVGGDDDGDEAEAASSDDPADDSVDVLVAAAASAGGGGATRGRSRAYALPRVTSANARARRGRRRSRT